MSDNQLLSIEARMRTPDAIMEPGIGEAVGAYIRAGGRPEHVIESLAGGYEGAAQMANLLCSWIKDAEVPYAPPGSAAARDCGETSTSGEPPDAFTFLQELVRERFDPGKLLAVFRRGRPTWLHELTADARGRRLVLDLSSAHPNSIFLNYAMRRMFDMGHAEEVAAVGASLSGYFEVFHTLLSRNLEAVAAAARPQQLRKLSADVAAAALNSQHTYAHARAVLARLARGPAGARGVFRRMGQELEAAAAERYGGGAVYAMQPLFVPPGEPQAVRDAVQLVSRALVMATGGADGGGGGAGGGSASLSQVSLQLTQLLELCRAAAFAGDAAPVLDVLRHPRVLQLLLEGLFSTQQASPAVQSVACQLLSLAAVGPTRHADGASAASHLAPAEAQRHLDAARAVGLRAASGEKLGDDDLDTATQGAATLPLAGAGLMHLVASVLGSKGMYEDARCASVVPSLLALLQRLLQVHPGRAPAAAAALGGGLTAMGARRPELSEALGSALVGLLTEGHAADVLAAAEAWAGGGADPSLVRAFTLRVLERAGPPYAQAFARPLVRLLAAGKMDTAKRGSMLLPGGPLERVREFAGECLDMRNWAPPLSGAEADMLQRLEA